MEDMITPSFESLRKAAVFKSEIIRRFSNPKDGKKTADSYQLFEDFIHAQYRYISHFVGFHVEFLDRRIANAYEAWLHDISRIDDYSLPKSSKGVDYLKMSGALAYWLRRSPPVSSMYSYSDSSMGREQLDKGWCELFVDYVDAYLAFDVGYRLCCFYDKNQRNGHSDPGCISPPKLDFDYMQCISYFLKFKNVSPHAMMLIYKSLLTNK